MAQRASIQPATATNDVKYCRMMAELLGEIARERNAPLVAARLMLPRSASTIVSRHRLLRLMESAARGPITIVSGEAAAGKTSAVVDWIDSMATDRPVAWMTAHPNLADPVLFWRYVLAAVEPLGIDCEDLELALNDEEPPGERWLIALANRLAAVSEEPVLVLDDLHELQSAEAWESLLALLERTPSTLHVVLTTRSMPPWQLARWRVSGRLAEIDSADLRFTHDEARALVDLAEIELNDTDVALLVERTEGWAGGMRLALLSMRHAQDPGAFVAQFAADDEVVASYLFREVLARQPQETRSFLLDISILDQVTPEVADALRDRNDSAELLERCQAENLFVTEFRPSGAYHLHRLFAQLLRATLDMNDPERLGCLHRRASALFERLGDIRTSITHAMSAGDFTRVGELVTSHAGELARRGRFDEIRSWLTLLPDDAKSVEPAVVIGLAMTLSICGRAGDAIDQLDRLAAQEISPRVRYASNQARLVAHAVDGDVETMAHAADVLGEGVPGGELPLPFEPVRMAECYQGIAAFLANDLEQARTSLKKAVERRDDPNIQYVESPGWLARVAHAEGNLAESERQAHECLARNDKLGGAETAVVTPAYLALADVAWERARLDEAEAMLVRARRSVRPLLWYSVLLQISASRLLASRGELDDARQQLSECGQTYLRGGSSPLLRTLLCERAIDLALMAGDADDARRWESSYDAEGNRPLALSLQLRLAASAGEDEARSMVERAVLAEQPIPQMIDTLLAGAAVVGSAGDERRCIELVAMATHLAEPHGLVGRFLGAGSEAHNALRTLAATPSEAEGPPVASRFFVESLISALSVPTAGAARAAPHSDAPIEPLTRRELQVLDLLVAGQSYADIGAQLYVSRNTVKSHASHIYTKLGVSGRSAAAEEARRLSLV